MLRNPKENDYRFSRVLAGSAILVLMAGLPTFLRNVLAADAGYIRIVGPQGVMDGSSKDPAHLNWVVVSSVVSGDLSDDAAADREASIPAVSELTSKPAANTSIGSQSSGAGAGKVAAAAPRDTATGLATGKRMHKPFTITKEIDKASPLLAKACASGQHLPEVDVQLTSGVKYMLFDVMVSAIKNSGGERPMESVTFTYQKIVMSH